jgi:L-lactate dehydrogenase complex protein LldF
MKIDVERFREKAAAGIANQSQREILEKLRIIFSGVRDYAFSTLPDPEGAIEKACEIRRETIARLPIYLEMLKKNVEINGGTVLWARDHREARELIGDIARNRGVRIITKGKSMATEEMNLNERLIKDGIDVFETDLGEFIVQQAGRTPFHIVGPAVNLPTEEVADLFQRVMGVEKTNDLNELTMHARRFLREKFERADMGITGVNLAVAETGTIMLVENEGNIRYSTSAPKTHIAVMGIEKVVPTIEDACHLLKLLTRSCTGQTISSYVSFLNSPRKPGEVDGPEEFFLVIVDGGRTKIYQDPDVREVLQCIKCGACLNVCPVWSTVGGYAYGWVYSGPIGSLLNPLLIGLDRAKDLYHATTLCGRCKQVCPVGVDHPKLFLKLRRKRARGESRFRAKKPPLTERSLYSLWGWALQNENRYRRALKAARFFLSLMTLRGTIKRLPSFARGFTAARDLPLPADTPFRERWEDLKKAICDEKADR